MAVTRVKVHQLTDGTDGELITWDASGIPTTVAVGTAGHVLTSNGVGAVPTFQAASDATTASNGLLETGNDITLGGALTSVTTLTGDTTNYLIVTGTRTSSSTPSLLVNNTSSGTALKTLASGLGVGVWGESTTGTGVYGSSGSIAVGGYSTGTVGNLFQIETAATGNILTVMALDALTTGTAVDGIGSEILFRNETSTTPSQNANTIVSKWATAAHASRISEISFTGQNIGVKNTLLSLLGTGKATLNKYGVGTFTGTAAYTLQVDASGNIIEGTVSGGSGDISNGGNTTGAAINIGTNDAFDLNFETQGVQRLNITGGASTGGAVTITNVNANINSVQNVLTLRANSNNGTVPAAGYGTGLLFQGESNASDNRDLGSITPVWTTATDASRSSDIIMSAVNSTVLGEVVRFVGGTFPGINIASAVGTQGTTKYTNGGINTGSNYKIGNSANTIELATTSVSTGAIILTAEVNTASSTAGIFVGNTITLDQTAGTRNYMHFNYSFSPTSGTAVHNRLHFTGTLNQTGGASGIVRGINLAHTVTAVADYRAIEVADNGANVKGIYQTGATTVNNFVGKTMFGSTTAPTAQLEVDNAANAVSILVAKDNGSAVFTVADGGGITSTSSGRHTFTSSNSTTSGAIELIPSSLTSGTDVGVKISGPAYTATGNSNKVVQITASNTRASGSFGGISMLFISPTMDFTGTAEGATVAIEISPTLTNQTAAGAKFFGLYMNYSSAKAYGVCQTGIDTLNVLVGKTSIGSTTDPTEMLNVTGNMIVVGQYASTNFALTDGATIALNWNNSNVQYVTLAGNRTFTFANPKQGGRYIIALKQNGVGSKTVTWPTITWKGGTAPTLTTTANKTDLITLTYINSVYYGDASLNY